MFKFFLSVALIFSFANAKAFNQNSEQQLRALYSQYKEPEGNERTENTTYMVLESLHTAYVSYEITRNSIPTLFEIQDRKIIVSDKLPETWVTQKGKIVPVDGLIAQVASVVKVYRNYGLGEKFALEFAFRIQKEIVEALGSNWSEYEAFILPHLKASGLKTGNKLLSDKILLDGLKEVKKLITVSKDFDVPYLAGYSANNDKMIYIDSGMKATMNGKFGRVDLADFLIIHEVTEKLLMDEWSFRENIYVHTHQFAQRLEKEMAEANGLSWDIYQGEVMEKEIKRAEDPKRTFTQTPEDLDLTPYLEYKDDVAISQIKEFARPSQCFLLF